MANVSGEFEVENVVGKRFRDRTTQYNIKWLNYDETTWTNVDQCSCDELIDEFEMTQLLQSVVGVARIDGYIQYATLMKISRNRMDMVSTNRLGLHAPEKLIGFLENGIQFMMPTQRVINSIKIVLSNNEIDGIPTAILGCTDIGTDGLKYFCEWPMGQYKVVTSRDAHAQFPQLVIAYLEGSIDFSAPAVTHTTELMPITRKLNGIIQRKGVNFKPKLVIVRHIGFENALLVQPAKVVERRRTVNIAKAPKNIPMGARGRRRRRQSVMFIGLHPNLDDNVRASAPQHQALSSTPPPPPPPKPSPPKPARLDAIDELDELEVAFGTLHFSDSE